MPFPPCRSHNCCKVRVWYDDDVLECGEDDDNDMDDADAEAADDVADPVSPAPILPYLDEASSNGDV